MAKRCQNYDFYFNESSILQSRRSRPISRLKVGIQHLFDAYMPPYQLDLSELKSSFRPFVAFGAFLRPLDPIFWIENFQLIIVLMGAAFIYAIISAISSFKNCIPGVQFRTLCSKIEVNHSETNCSEHRMICSRFLSDYLEIFSAPPRKSLDNHSKTSHRSSCFPHSFFEVVEYENYYFLGQKRKHRKCKNGEIVVFIF